MPGLALALEHWWQVRGRLAGNAGLPAAAVGYAAPGSIEWCGARMLLGQAALHAGDSAAALGHFTAVRDAFEDAGSPASPWQPVVLSLCLDGRSGTLSAMGRSPGQLMTGAGRWTWPGRAVTLGWRRGR